MKYMISGLVSIVFLCSVNHASAEVHSKELPRWERLGLVDLVEHLTFQVSWKPNKDYTHKDEFPHFRCYQNNINCAKLRAQYDTEYSHWLREKDRAYACYRYGKGCDVCIRNGSSVNGCTETKPAQYPAPGRQ